MTVTDQNYFCVTSSSIWQFAGFLLFALKIIIPLIIIILGVIDFVNATISNKEDAITAATKSLVFRLVIGVVVFFVPMIVSLVFNLIENASDAVASADACQKCLLRPFIEDCASYVAEAKSIRENQKNLLDSSTHDMSDYETSSARCFYCPDEQKYVWTTNPSCKDSQYIKRYTTQSDCENPDNLTLMPNIIGSQEEEETNNRTPSSSGSSSSGSSSDSGSSSNTSTKTEVLYVGDTRMEDICNVNNISNSNCFYAEYNGYNWLNGDYKYGEALKFIKHSSSDPINDIKSLIEKNSSTKYTIVVNLGTYDLDTVSAAKYVSKYTSLAKNQWKQANIVITQVAPVGTDNYRNLANTTVTSFNSNLNDGIRTAKSRNQNNTGSEGRLENLKYCSLQLGYNSNSLSGYVDMKNYLIVSGDHAKGILFEDEGNKIIYNKIQECLK